MAAYAASKAAATQLVKSLGLEVAQYGIRCNTVAPGSTDTPMLRSMWHDREAEQHTLDGSPPRTASASRCAGSAAPTTSRRRWRSCSPTGPPRSPCTT